jgi:hypothetical protein
LYVIAKDKKTYEIKYFNIQQDEAADEWFGDAWILSSNKFFYFFIFNIYIINSIFFRKIETF